MTSILALDISGTPRKWINLEQAITYHVKNQVAWYLGDIVATLRGGYRRIDGTRSEVSTPSIIAIRSSDFAPTKVRDVPLTNRALFARDRQVCAYCGKVHTLSDCSREHIHPVSRGGKDVWTNVVTACKRCNHHKGAKTLDEARMELLYVPYMPNHYEHLILQNRNILADQMEYLITGVPKHSRIFLN
jgi:5-methylcytosine-specific restriction endonuclease McrA